MYRASQETIGSKKMTNIQASPLGNNTPPKERQAPEPNVDDTEEMLLDKEFRITIIKTLKFMIKCRKI